MVITVVQIILAILLVATILLQQRGSGMSGVFGGDSSAYATRRGAEKVIFIATIVIAILFIVVSVVRLIL